MKNIEIRMMIQKSGFRFYQVAEKLGISESYFSRLLRNDLLPEWEKRITDAVTEMQEGRLNAV